MFNIAHKDDTNLNVRLKAKSHLAIAKGINGYEKTLAC